MFKKLVIITGIIFVVAFIAYALLFKKIKVKSITTALDKEVSQQILPIEGKIPEWLNGTFVRNGPVSVQIDDQKTMHWFDGLAMLHAFSFNNGKVSYTNKFLRTNAYKKVFIEGNLNYGGFATSDRSSLWKKIKTFFVSHSGPEIQNANVNVAEIAGQYVALTETPLPVRFDIKMLDTLGVLEFQDNLPKKNIFESAHIQYDGKTKEKINYLVKYGKESQYIIYSLDPKAPRRMVIGEIGVEKPAYMHSFALTEHYVILIEFPFRVNPIELMLMSKPFIKNFYWYPEQGTNFLIIDRKTGKKVKTVNDKNPFFAFHHVNAYEENDKIILDIITYPDVQEISGLAYHDKDLIGNEGEKETLNRTKLMRYILSPNEDVVHSMVLLEVPIEFPRINETHNARPYRYLYAVDPRSLKESKDLRPLYKLDVITGNKITWQEPGLLPGEPVFVPSPPFSKEDEGVVVTIVLDVVKQKAFLLVLDGQTFQEIGRAYAPNSIPIGLHGQFFGDRGDDNRAES